MSGPLLSAEARELDAAGRVARDVGLDLADDLGGMGRGELVRQLGIARLHRRHHVLVFVDILARQAGVSPRTFSRRFVEETGYTPMQWVMRARIDLARELLERSQRSVEQIAADIGLGTGANLRLHFQRILGTTPSEYRRTFTRGE